MERTFTPEEEAQFARLLAGYADATEESIHVLEKYGFDSEEFAEVDDRAGKFAEALRKLQGVGT